MNVALELPGLMRIVEVCRTRQLRLRMDPPLGSPTPGELTLGMPLDPMLAAFYRRMGGATFQHLFIYQYARGHHEDLAMLMANEIYRRDGEELYCSALIFGKEASLAYHYATLPSLADAAGLQPVIYIDGYEERVVLPVASNVDQFFDLYSRYLEVWTNSEEVSELRPLFPWDVPELVARDSHLVEALMSRRYDPWVTRNAETDRWYERVLAAAQVSNP